MRCNICRNKQAAYERRELERDERRAIEAHLRTCEQCRQYYGELERLGELLEPVEVHASAHDVWPRVAARIAARRAQTVLARLLRPAAAAAMLAAAAAVAVSLIAGPPPRALPGSGGAETLLKYSDTGVVWIDPWAGPAAQGLDWILTERRETKVN